MSEATGTVIEEELLAGGESPDGSSTDAETGASDEGAAAGAEDGAPASGSDTEDAESGELVVSIGDAPPEADDAAAPPWVKDLRKQNRELVRAMRQKDARLAQLEASANPAPQPIGAKPTLEGCDFDAEKFEIELEKWQAKKREADDAQRQRQQAEEQQRARWQGRLAEVDKASQAIKVPDYEEASEAFEATFNVVQQGVIMDGPKDPKDAALLRYALGKNPGVAKRLAAEDNPVRFAFEVARILNKELSVKSRTAPPPPDTVVRSGVAGAVAGDVKLAELHRKAQETGNYGPYLAYKREKAAKKAAA